MAVCETSNSPTALRNTNKLGLRQFQRRGVHSQDWGAATHPGLSLAQEQHTGEVSRCLRLSAPHGSSPWLCAARIQLCPWGFLPVLTLRKRPKATAGALQEQGDCRVGSKEETQLCSKDTAPYLQLLFPFYPFLASVSLCPCFLYSDPDLHSAILKTFTWHL